MTMQKTLKWKNLKANKCPDCGKDWLVGWNACFENGMIICKCGFKISQKRMTEVVSDQVSHEIMNQEYDGIRISK